MSRRDNRCAVALAAIAVSLSIATPAVRAAQSSFTPSQLEEIRRLIDDARVTTRAELLDEVKRELMADLGGACPPADKEIADAPTDATSMERPDARIGAQVDAPAMPRSTSQSLTELFLGAAAQAPLDRESGPALSAFELSAGSDDSRASFRYAAEISETESDGSKVYTTAAATFSSPLTKAPDKITELATLDGLANSTELGFTLARWYVNGARLPADISMLDQICGIAGIDTQESPCDDLSVRAGLERAGRLDLYDQFRSAFWDKNATRWTWGLSAKLGHEEFTFFDQMLVERTESKTPWSIGSYIGWVPGGQHTFYSLGATFQNAYRPSDEATACMGASAPVLQCVTGSLEAPSNRRRHLVYAELRGRLADIPYSIRATHDLKSNRNGVDLPIYLFQAPNGDFNAGIRLGWTSTDRGSVGLFIGAPFALYR